MSARLKRLTRSPFLRFMVSGGIAAAVNVSSRIALSRFVDYEIAIVVAYLIGMTTAYLLMMPFVFGASGRSVPAEYARFSLVNLIALCQVWLVSVGLADWLFPAIGFGWHSQTVAHVIGVISPIASSYVGHRSFTFARIAPRSAEPSQEPS